MVNNNFVNSLDLHPVIFAHHLKDLYALREVLKHQGALKYTLFKNSDSMEDKCFLNNELTSIMNQIYHLNFVIEFVSEFIDENDLKEIDQFPDVELIFENDLFPAQPDKYIDDNDYLSFYSDLDNYLKNKA